MPAAVARPCCPPLLPAPPLHHIASTPIRRQPSGQLHLAQVGRRCQALPLAALLSTLLLLPGPAGAAPGLASQFTPRAQTNQAKPQSKQPTSARPPVPAAPAAAAAVAEPAQAAPVLEDLNACAAVVEAPQRLACYDRALGRPIDTLTHPEADVPPEPATVERKDGARPPVAAPALANPPGQGLRLPTLLSAPGREDEDKAFSREALAERRSLGSNLSDRWELDPAYDRGRFTLTAYKPMYVLFADWTSGRNLLPTSPNPNNVVSTPIQQRSTEAVFQISFKTKVIEDMIAGYGDLWLGYTQVSHWQIYNPGGSRPFRETNYEPEMIATFRTHYSLLGWSGKMVGLALNHQSNGRDEPQSRSWNRIIGMIGLERGNWTMMLRPWWRIPEAAASDDNPDISDYAGRMDLVLIHQDEGREFSLLARHSLRGGSRSHGSVQLGYAMPISSYLKGYVQVFSGYGASLLDYNHRQTRIGIGISMVQWL